MKTKLLILMHLLLAALFLISGCAAKNSSSDRISVTPQYKHVDDEMNPEAYHHFTNAVIYTQEGAYNEAIREYEMSLSYDPLSYDIRMSLAELYFRLQRFDNAINAILPIPSKDGDVYLLLGDAFRKMNKLVEAESAYKNALEYFPNNTAISLNLALIARQSGELPQAAHFYHQVARQTNNPDTWQDLADIYLQREMIDSTIICLEIALAINRSDPILLGRTAYYYANAGRVEEAKKLLREALSIQKDNGMLYTQLVEIYSSEKQLDSVVTISERMLENTGKDHASLETVGILLLGYDKIDLAKDLFIKALGINNQSVLANFYLGRIALDANKLDDAKQYFSDLIDVDDKIPDGWINLALSYHQDKKQLQAIAVLLEGLEQVTYERDDLRFFLSQLLTEQDMQDSSINVLRQILEEDGDTVRALFGIAAQQEQLKRFEKAVATFEWLLSIDSNYTPALNYLGYMLADKGVQLEKSLKLTQKAVAVDSTNGAYLDSYAWALYKLERYQEALTQIKKAVSIMTDDPVIAEHLGDIYNAMGNYGEAYKAWQRALALDPENETLKQKLSQTNP